MLAERDLKNEGIGERVDVHVERRIFGAKQMLIVREAIFELRATLDSFLQNSMRKRGYERTNSSVRVILNQLQFVIDLNSPQKDSPDPNEILNSARLEQVNVKSTSKSGRGTTFLKLIFV